MESALSYDSEPENACFCDSPFWSNYGNLTKEKNELDCLSETSGSVVVQSGYFGVPFMASLPHFMYGTDELKNKAKGDINPGPQYDTVLEYEPTTGGLMNAAKRLQFSLFLNKDESFYLYQGMEENTMVIPLIWINESFVLPPDYEAEAAEALAFIEIFYWIQVAAMVIGVVGLVLGGFCLFRVRKCK